MPGMQISKTSACHVSDIEKLSGIYQLSGLSKCLSQVYRGVTAKAEGANECPHRPECHSGEQHYRPCKRTQLPGLAVGHPYAHRPCRQLVQLPSRHHMTDRK